MKYVLDASAVVSFFEKGKGSEKVQDILIQSLQGKCELLMSVINWGEVYYALWLKQGRSVAEEKLRVLSRFPIRLIPAETELTRFAASLKAEHRLPYADCFAAAVAALHDAEVVTTDADFRRIQGIVPVVIL